MAALYDLAMFLPVIGVLEVLSVAFSILFMHYNAKFLNKQLSLGWYICGVVFGLWTLIVFLIKRKDFPGASVKVCQQCEDKFPESFSMCPKCLIDLPVIDAEAKKKEKKLSKLFGILIIFTYIAALVTGIFMGKVFSEKILESTFDDLWLDNRISVDGVFYDKMGNSYENWEDVLLYDEKGRTYTYSVEEQESDEEDIYLFSESFYVRDDGEKYFAYDCYVTEAGWFYCDKAGIIELYSTDTDSMNEEELDEYYEGLVDSADEEYKYYDYPYSDKAGNIYYCADEASWNQNGELITAKNDISG